MCKILTFLNTLAYLFEKEIVGFFSLLAYISLKAVH